MNTVSISIKICGVRLKMHSNLHGKNSNFEFESQIILRKCLLRLNMHVTSEIPLNLANKMNLEQKQWLQLQARRLVFCLGGFFFALKGPLILTVSHKIKLIAEDFPVEVDGCVILMPSSMRIWIAPYNRVVIQRLLILKLPSILSFHSRHICNTSVTFSQLRFQ